jgi:hypothetical protein
MSHRTQRALFFILAGLAAASVARAQQADAPSAAAQVESKPAAGDTAPVDTSAQSDHSSTTGSQPSNSAQPAQASEAAKPGQLPPVHVNGGPSDDILRSARDAGFKIKVANGKTHFCKTGAAVGTRFETESCMNEQQVTLWLERAQAQKDKLMTLLGAPAIGH